MPYTITDLNNLMYVGAKMVSMKFKPEKQLGNDGPTKPGCEIRLKKKNKAKKKKK